MSNITPDQVIHAGLGIWLGELLSAREIDQFDSIKLCELKFATLKIVM